MILAPTLSLLSRAAGPRRFSPRALSPYLWLDASQLRGLSDGAEVTVWPDLSGNGYDAVASALPGFSFPTYRMGVVNGRPVVRFAGVVGISSPVRVPLSDSSVFVVAETNAIDTTRAILGQPGRRLGCLVSDGSVVDAGSLVYSYNAENDPAGYTAVLSSNTFFQASFTEDSEDSIINAWLNGTPGSNVAGGMDESGMEGPAADLNIGSGLNEVGDFPWNGDIAEVIICPAVNDATRLAVEGYLRGNWGIG